MEAFTQIDAIAAPFPISNVDTDKIIPGRFLKTITRDGLGTKLFWALRQQPDFILNRSPWNSAAILVALENFGCGSSREHAPWALFDFGFRCIIAPSFADIFYNNCFKNGILPLVLPSEDIVRLLDLAGDPATAKMTVDLVSQTVRTADGRIVSFELEGERKTDLLAGIDDIARTLTEEAAIGAFETQYRQAYPWIDEISTAIGTVDDASDRAQRPAHLAVIQR